jgi:hypothetical protein
MMKPFKGGTATSSPAITNLRINDKEEDAAMIISNEDISCDIENQMGEVIAITQSPSCSCCHGVGTKKRHPLIDQVADLPDQSVPVEYHCSVCQYFLCEDCYTNELKKLNNIPVTALNNSIDKEEDPGSVDTHDIESGYGAPTESCDTEEDRLSTRHFRGGGGRSSRGDRDRQFETMSTQVEVDNFSVKSNTDVTSTSDYIQVKPTHSSLQLSSEDALSDHDLETISTSTHHFRLFPQQIVQATRKMSVGGLTYSSIDSDSLKDDDSMSHFRVEGQLALAENPSVVDDDDNMTSVSTIHSTDGVEVSSLLISNLPPPPVRNSHRRKFSLHSQEDTQSVGGGQTCTSNYSVGPHSEGEDDEDEVVGGEEMEGEEGDENKGKEKEGLERRDEEGDDPKQDPLICDGDGAKLDGEGDGDESVSDGDGGLDNDDETMSIGSIDSTKCYPNNLYHSKGFLTIASLHKTDSPSGYLTHHLSSLPSTASLRYTSNGSTMRRYSKLPSPSHSHFNSSLVEEEVSHHSSPPPPSPHDSPTTLPPPAVLPIPQEIHCLVEE